MMQNLFRALCGIAVLCTAMCAYSQNMTSDRWTREGLLERAQHLRQAAAQGDGSASETLEKYPHHYTMLAFRSRNGGGEVHENFADVFTIVDGHVTLITGGDVTDAKTTAPGEIRGTGVYGGTRQELRAGDVVHIPAGTPHQMLVAEGETVTYFVVKIEEKR